MTKIILYTLYKLQIFNKKIIITVLYWNLSLKWKLQCSYFLFVKYMWVVNRLIWKFVIWCDCKFEKKLTMKIREIMLFYMINVNLYNTKQCYITLVFLLRHTIGQMYNLFVNYLTFDKVKSSIMILLQQFFCCKQFFFNWLVY